MGAVLPFRPRQQPSKGGADGFQPAAPLVTVVVHRPDVAFADLILAGSEFAFAWSEALLAHAVSLAVVRTGSHRHNPMGTRCEQTARPLPENFGDRK